MNNQVTTKNTNALNGFSDNEIGDDHLFTGLETPMKKDAFKLTDVEKKAKIYLKGSAAGLKLKKIN